MGTYTASDAPHVQKRVWPRETNCDKGDTEFGLGDLEFVLPVKSVDLMACVGSFEKTVLISPRLSVSVTKTFNHLFENSIL